MLISALLSTQTQSFVARKIKYTFYINGPKGVMYNIVIQRQTANKITDRGGQECNSLASYPGGPVFKSWFGVRLPWSSSFNSIV
jgi:hypothetical protein